MTGRTVAIAHWRAQDRWGDDKCRLARADHGWLLVGHARFRDCKGFAALDYVLRCDENWHSLGADIAGLHDGADVSLRIERFDDGWQVNDSPQSGVGAMPDLDLGFTPATNLMPLRRLALQQSDRLSLTAAWLNYPRHRLWPLDQVYSRTGVSGRVAYSAAQTGHETVLEVDPSGLITLYPGLWEGEVIHAAS